MILCALLLLVTIVPAQDIQYRARVDLVIVPTSVRDSDGKLVPGLTKDDFSVFEDGTPQTILNFSNEPQPLSAAIVVDTGMGGNSLRKLVPLLISVTGGFSPFDEMVSFRYDHLVHQLSEFTNDHEKIDKSFDVVKSLAEKQPPTVPSGTAAPTAPRLVQMLSGFLNAGYYGGRSPVDPTIPPTERLPTVQSRTVPQSRVLYDAIFDAAKALESRPVNRRKILFIISDGQVAGTNTHNLDEVGRLLMRDEIQVYAVGMDLAALEGKYGVLSTLAQDTGGDSYGGLTVNSMETAFNRITEQARNQYVLGYHSSNKLAGLAVERTIAVKGRDPKWKVMHRRSYTQMP